MTKKISTLIKILQITSHGKQKELEQENNEVKKEKSIFLNMWHSNYMSLPQ